MTRTGRSPRQPYVHALRYRWLTRYYDALIGGLMRETQFKRRLIEQAGIEPHHRVLDLGCGTGTLTVMTKQHQPSATVVGLDGDDEILRLATQKVEDAGIEVAFHHGNATSPPFEPATFDRIVSSLMFHHLSTQDKLAALSAMHRLLKPGGQLHIADWGQAQNVVMRIAFLSVQCLDGFATTTDNVRGRLPEYLIDAGFTDVEEVSRQMTLFGTLSFYRARRA